MRLATRTFLWSVVPFALLLIGSFWTVQTLVMSAVRDGLRATVRSTQSTIATMRDRTAQRDSRVLRVVAENPALKAGLQLLLSNADDPQARRTVEDQLTEIGGELGFDFLLVSHGDGHALAAILRQDGNTQPLNLQKTQPPRQGFFTPGGTTYQVISEPIDQGSENLGTLSVGEPFDLSTVPIPAVLLHNGKIVQTNSTLRLAEAEAALRGCTGAAECELRMGGEQYLSLSLESGPDAAYQIRSLQSVDAATGPVQ
jgi:hypothetical protein